MKRNFFFIIFAIFTNSSCSIFKKNAINDHGNFNQVIKFISLNNNSYSVIDAYLKIDSVQKKSENGLQFSIILKNNSSNTVSIRNILDGYSLGLLNESIDDVLFPYIPKILVNPRLHYNNQSFKILKVLINQQTLDTTTSTENQFIIPAMGTYELFFGIPNILNANAIKPYTYDQTIETPKGTYSLLMSVLIAEKTKSTSLHINPIKILYN